MIDASTPGSRREVGCDLTFEIGEPSLLALQVAPARSAGLIIEERLEIATDRGELLTATAEVGAELTGRIHLVSTPPGTWRFSYSATLEASPPSPPSLAASTTPAAVPDFEAMVALRQSRYCPSDSLTGFAATEFEELADRGPDEIGRQVASWVFERLAYASGASGPFDTAVHTLLSGSGVCRDFADLTIALCRALGVPARLAAVYAPGLSPMDFHAVVEIATPLGWQVFDPTRLAPRRALVRIATGRDAADTAFATTLRGDVELIGSNVFASSDGNLPSDDHISSAQLA